MFKFEIEDLVYIILYYNAQKLQRLKNMMT